MEGKSLKNNERGKETGMNKEQRHRETEWDVKGEKAAGRGEWGERTDMDVRVIKRQRMGIWKEGK